ncbi:EthD family reductase [Cupriavidus sp. CuC1]|uniref:EthD family reductase n=1 Tax=Cupriavidus sp. CuC1 TaxID=3373131 RepID=UPI0037D2C06F
MAKLVVLYKKPADTAAFDSYYFSTHVPITKKITGLRRYEVSSGPVCEKGMCPLSQGPWQAPGSCRHTARDARM